MDTQPTAAFAALVRRAVTAAFGADYADVDPQVRRSERADVQADLAMGLSRRAKKAPRAIAEAIVAAIPPNDLVAKLEIAGPGFINATLRDSWLAAATQHIARDARLGVPGSPAPETIVVDYSHPNVAKEMHVGHLRSTVIGDALVRVLGFRGHAIIRQNHIGDWGTPFGMLIEHLDDLGDSRAEAELAIGELGAFYKAARDKFDSDPAFADRSRKRVVSLQAGDAKTLARWRTLVELSMRYFETVYARLGITLTRGDLAGESFYNDRLAPLARELEASGYARISDGALCAFPAGFKNREGNPLALIIRKSDGGFGYAATDLSALRYRLAERHATRILYVVGAPQQQHLAMVFQVARELGWLAEPARAQHVPFGSVLDTNKQMLKSREGNTIRLVGLIDEAIARAHREALAKGVDPADAPGIARIVGVGAIKYADLANDRVKDYIFDLDRMVSFEGNTAGYAQYAHARARSVIRKAGGAPPAAIAIAEPAERALALALLDLPAVVAAVEDSLEPHRLATYVHDVAAAFTAFYDACPVISAEPATRASRLVLVDTTARVITCALGLLGIDVLERM